jgi:glutamate synthase (NADPH/NADH) large chain
MSGGVAYVLDEDGEFEKLCNRAMVAIEDMPEWIEGEIHGDLADMSQHDNERLRRLIANHARYTGSRRAAEIMARWTEFQPKFRKVMPHEFRRALAELKAAEDLKPRLAAGA